MKTNPDDCAFPIEVGQSKIVESGLTVREYFAIMALQACVNSDELHKITIEVHCMNALTFADELIKQLNG